MNTLPIIGPKKDITPPTIGGEKVEPEEAPLDYAIFYAPMDSRGEGCSLAGVVGGGDRVATHREVATSPLSPLRGAPRWHDSAHHALVAPDALTDSYRAVAPAPRRLRSSFGLLISQITRAAATGVGLSNIFVRPPLLS